VPIEKRAAAYHETGHFCRAILAHEGAVDCATIQPDAHGWGGNTPVNKGLIATGESHLCCIAVAGFLAEAKGVAGKGLRSPQIAYSPELLSHLKDIIEGPFHRTNEEAWEIRVPLAAGGTSPGAVTRPDLEEIPGEERTLMSLEMALRTTVAFLNTKSFVVDILAGYLEKKEAIENGDFYRWLIQQN
jgi:hypothetical protein